MTVKRTMRWAGALLAGALVVGPGAGATAGPGRPAGGTVTVEGGRVRGGADGGAVRYQRIPYAAPPTGRLRWQAPQRAARWSGVRDGTAPAPPCPQVGGDGRPAPGTAEDCLYLNVTAPARPAKRHRPVMVWLHGGGMTLGAGSRYHPTRMAVDGDVVVVTVDFRIGMLGNFALAGLPGSGTFGMQDEQAALRWVHRNIAAFGGDAGNVTLFGESGGGVGTCGLLTSPASAGLFGRAIMESGSCDLAWPRHGLGIGLPGGSFWRPLPDVEKDGARSAATLKCPTGDTAATLACLRGRSPDALLAENSHFGGAATGTPVLPLAPPQALAEGRFPAIPVLSGHNRDEARIFAAIADLSHFPVTAANYPGLLTDAFGKDAEPAVAARYPLRSTESPAITWSTMDTDRVFACTQLDTTRAVAAHNRGRTYAYEFADPGAPSLNLPNPPFPQGALHGAELHYLFDAVDGLPATLTPAQKTLSAAMIRYWTRFARTGDPNGPGTPYWAPSTGGAAQSLAPGAGGIHPVDDGAGHHCDFWHGLGR